MKEAIKKSAVLIEALPYIKRFYGKVVVIKHGGSTLGDKKITRGILEDIVFMSYAGMKPVLVHGGGSKINTAMKKLGKEPRFVNGQRITDREAVHIVDKALSEVNRWLVSEIKRLGGKAYGLSGRDSGLITARKIRASPVRHCSANRDAKGVSNGASPVRHCSANRDAKGVSNGASVDLGFVGEVSRIGTTLLDRLLDANIIPVVSPVGRGSDGELYNINADSSAAKIAGALKAEKIFILTNVKGVLKNRRDSSSLFNTLKTKEVKRLIKKGIIAGGMIPKVSACLLALKGGVKKAHIVSASLPHALLLEIFTREGIGTEIIK